MNDKRYWIGFNLIKGIGAVRMQALIRHFGDLEVAWKAAPADLAQASLGLKVIERIIQARESVDLEKLWAKIEAQGIKILTWEDEAYPQRLKEIEQPPPVIYVRGEITMDDHFAVAIVGTRPFSSGGGPCSSIPCPFGVFVAGSRLIWCVGDAFGFQWARRIRHGPTLTHHHLATVDVSFPHFAQRSVVSPMPLSSSAMARPLLLSQCMQAPVLRTRH